MDWAVFYLRHIIFFSNFARGCFFGGDCFAMQKI